MPSRPKSAPTRRGPPHGLLLLLAALSGVSALVYEGTWIRWFRLLFGSTTHASSATLCAFFGGLAVGAALFGRFARRTRNPLRAYALVELGVAVSALWVPLAASLYDPFYAGLYERFAGRREVFTAVKLGLALLAMLPTSVLLGGTMPLLAAAVVGEGRRLGRLGSRLYAVNTLGAALGAPLGALVLPERVGLGATYGIAVGVTLLVGGASWAAARRRPASADVGTTADAATRAAGSEAPRGPRRKETTAGAPRADASTAGASSGTPAGASTADAATAGASSGASTAAPRSLRAPLLLAAASGFGVLAFEVLLIHASGQLFTHSAYTYGLVLVLVLVGLGLGAALVSWTADRVGAAALLRGSTLAVGVLLLLVPFAVRALGPWVLALGFLVFLVAGLVFPLTFRLVDGGHAGERLGLLLAANTAGGILGSLAGSFLMLGGLGLWPSLGWLAVLYAGAALCVSGPRTARVRAALVFVVALSAVRLGPADPWRLDPVVLRDGETLLALEEGATGIVSVVESADGNRRIKVDDSYTFGDSRNKPLAERMAHLPLLLHPAPGHVAIIGSATGTVAGGALLHPVEQIDLVEIVPEVHDVAAEWFAHVNRGVHADPRTRLVTEDGRNHVRAAPHAYDVIVEDLFVPTRPTAAAMYTREHYRDARERLADGGVFCQWLPVYQLDEETLLVVVATFLEVFPEATLWRPHVRPHEPIVGLVGIRGAAPHAEQVEARARELAALGIDDPWVTDPVAVWMNYLAPAAHVFDHRPDAPVHHDGHPFFEFMTARFEPRELSRYRYEGWVKLCDALTKRTPRDDTVFPDRPRHVQLGANAMLRANLAFAGGAKDHAQTSWREAMEHLPPHLLTARDASFGDLWPIERE